MSDPIKTISIYYDKHADVLTFKRRPEFWKPIAKVVVPKGTKRDGDCVILPDHINAVFKNRRTSPLELFIRASCHFGEGLEVTEMTMHTTYTFLPYGKPKPTKTTVKAIQESATCP